LAASEAAQDIRGRAIACHSLGLISSQQKQWVEAQRYYRACEHLAQQAGELHLLGLARLNLAEVYLALEHPEAGRANAEAALHVFAQLDARRDKAGAHRVLGMIFRDTGRYALAESHLRAAVEIAVSTRCPLTEADAARELAQLYRAMVRTEDSLRCLERARGLYQRLAAWRELDAVEVGIEEMRTAWA
jgi:tetratricopeptide (TPR) repeat protein